MKLRKVIFISKFSREFRGNETLANRQNHSAVYLCWQIMRLSRMFSLEYMYSNAILEYKILENQILAKISELTVFISL